MKRNQQIEKLDGWISGDEVYYAKYNDFMREEIDFFIKLKTRILNNESVDYNQEFDYITSLDDKNDIFIHCLCLNMFYRLMVLSGIIEEDDP